MVSSSIVCFSLYPETSDKLDMKEAVRRFRRRFAGCDSSFLGWMLVNALRELPKMLRRLSLDMVSDYLLYWRAPPLARSAAVMAHAEGHGQLESRSRTLGQVNKSRAVQLRNVEFGGQSRRKLLLHGETAGGLKVPKTIRRYERLRLTLQGEMWIDGCNTGYKSWQGRRHGWCHYLQAMTNRRRILRWLQFTAALYQPWLWG